MSAVPFSQFAMSRTALLAGAWNAVSIPVGAIDTTVSLEDSTSSFRVASTNALAPGQGAFVPATGAYVFPGVAAETFTVYINPANATVAAVQTQR